eukprot:672354-Rhodomonas_salina.1
MERGVESKRQVKRVKTRRKGKGGRGGGEADGITCEGVKEHQVQYKQVGRAREQPNQVRGGAGL